MDWQKWGSWVVCAKHSISHRICLWFCYALLYCGNIMSLGGSMRYIPSHVFQGSFTSPSVCLSACEAALLDMVEICWYQSATKHEKPRTICILATFVHVIISSVALRTHFTYQGWLQNINNYERHNCALHILPHRSPTLSQLNIRPIVENTWINSKVNISA